MTSFDVHLDESSIKDFWRDGFVVLRDVVDPNLVLSMEEPIKKVFGGLVLPQYLGEARPRRTNSVDMGSDPCGTL